MEFSSTARLNAMSTLEAAKFKQDCLAILDQLGPEGLVITKDGKPVAKLVPIQTESAALIGVLAGKIRVHGDLETKGVRWDAESWHRR
jgi:antitoxin (DNA-binding transcriptional repressor) of toxin-antitoxin stability system